MSHPSDKGYLTPDEAAELMAEKEAAQEAPEASKSSYTSKSYGKKGK